MPSDRDLARLCEASYNDAAIWDRIWPETDSNPAQVALKDNILVFRGSVTRLDWFDDGKAVPVDNPFVGAVEKGFNHGLLEIFAEVNQTLGELPVVCGHSLGAARALIFGGMLAAEGRRPARIVGFGAPRPGFGRLGTLLREARVTGTIYCNVGDPVPDVPVPLAACPWQHPFPKTMIDIPPTALTHDPAPWFDFEDIVSRTVFCRHHIELYALGASS